jgi:hypothetical protein
LPSIIFNSRDDLVNTVDYSQIAKSALTIAETSQRLTVEALASDFAIICLQHQQIIRVRVRVEEPGSVRFSRSVGVEIDRIREGFLRSDENISDVPRDIFASNSCQVAMFLRK